MDLEADLEADGHGGGGHSGTRGRVHPSYGTVRPAQGRHLGVTHGEPAGFNPRFQGRRSRPPSIGSGSVHRLSRTGRCSLGLQRAQSTRSQRRGAPQRRPASNRRHTPIMPGAVAMVVRQGSHRLTPDQMAAGSFAEWRPVPVRTIGLPTPSATTVRK